MQDQCKTGTGPLAGIRVVEFCQVASKASFSLVGSGIGDGLLTRTNSQQPSTEPHTV